MSTTFDLEQPLEPGQQAPESGDGPAQQRGTKRQTLQSLEDAASELARAMGLPEPRGQAQGEALTLAARRALDAPDLDGINLKASEWDSHRAELDELLAAGVSLSAIRGDFSQTLTSESWN